MSRTGLDLVAARIFCPGQELVNRYAEHLRNSTDVDPENRNILADYVLRAYSPDPTTGRGHRAMMLLFEGENAVEKVFKAAGSLRQCTGSGETVRDTYGDFVVDDLGHMVYVEPAVLVGPTAKAVRETLSLWVQYAESDGGLADFSEDVFNADEEVQKTLVLIKPDNFRFPSSRPGNIIDIFSRSGLRIIAVQVHRMSAAEALRFYGPVQEVLRSKLKGIAGGKAIEAPEATLGFKLSEEIKELLVEKVGPCYGDNQFYRIIQFMTGLWVPDIPESEHDGEGNERCLAIVYKGENAVERIRDILGPTDPSKAGFGSVRREFGQDIMINAAHASDSPENAVREMGIIQPERDKITPWFKKYYG
jgi:nucleoside diphosphate kinase